MCSLFHFAWRIKNGGFHLVYESTCCLAWGVVFDRRKDRGVVCVFSIFNAGGRLPPTCLQRDRVGSSYLAGPVCRAAPRVALSSLPTRHCQHPEESALRVRCSHQACQAPPCIADGFVGTENARLLVESWTKKIRGQKSTNSPWVSGGGVGAQGHLTQRAD